MITHDAKLGSWCLLFLSIEDLPPPSFKHPPPCMQVLFSTNDQSLNLKNNESI